METNNDDVELYVRRQVTPIFNKFLQETPKNRTSVGEGRSENLGICYYNPHNYRLYFEFFKENFEPKKTPLTDPLRSVYLYKSLNHGKEHHYKGFMDCKITVKKSQVLVTPPKREYVIDMSKEINPQIVAVLKEKDEQCIKALKDWWEIWQTSKACCLENKILGEEKINKLDTKMMFDSPTVKKVYMENNVEFKDPVYAVNYLQNRAVEKIAPMIAEPLQILLEFVNRQNALKFLKENVNTSQDVIEYKEYVKLLSNQEIDEFCNWMFDKLGGVC